MAVENFKHLKDRVTFISGCSKNAGKTTFLNYMLPRLRSMTDFVFMTIGIDGESLDQISGVVKPAIETLEGDLFLTSERMLDHSDGSFQFIEVFPWDTVLGKLLLVRTVRKGLIELAGPENNRQLNQIISYVEKELEIKTLIIDGAVNRLTQVSTGDVSGFYYVCKVTVENMKSSLEKLKMISLMNRVDLLRKSTETCDTCYFGINGALKRTTLDTIPHGVNTIVIEDFTKVFLGYQDLLELLGKYHVLFLKKIRLEAFVLNLFNVSEEKFLTELEAFSIDDHCLFNPFKMEGQNG
jgi:hypothetical protein